MYAVCDLTLDMLIDSRNNLFRRSFSNVGFAWGLDFSQHSYPDVKKAVYNSARWKHSSLPYILILVLPTYPEQNEWTVLG